MTSSTSNSHRVIVVDDTSPDIQYSGSWFLDTSGSQDSKGNLGPVFNTTLHGVKEGPASLVYTFTGSKIEVLGTNDIQNQSGILNPSWECFVDGDSIPVNPFKWPENNWVLCDSPKLLEGTHVLTVNASVDSPQTFWIDQIRFIPSLKSQFTTETVLINTTDAMIRFAIKNGWGEGVGSSILTTTNQSTFALEFVGVSLSWYGVIPEKTSLVSTTGSYTVNGSGDSRSFFVEALEDVTSVTTYNVKYFETPLFPAGRHQLVVTYNGNNETAPLTLDYLIIQNASTSHVLSFPNPPSMATKNFVHNPGTNVSSPSDILSIGPGGTTANNVPNTTSIFKSPTPYSTTISGGIPTSIQLRNARKPDTITIAGYALGGIGIIAVVGLAVVLICRIIKSKKGHCKSHSVKLVPFQLASAVDLRFHSDGTKIRQEYSGRGANMSSTPVHRRTT